MTKFQCRNCGYRFDSGTEQKRCPYCGKAGSVGIDKLASDIIKEIDELLKG